MQYTVFSAMRRY